MFLFRARFILSTISFFHFLNLEAFWVACTLFFIVGVVSDCDQSFELIVNGVLVVCELFGFVNGFISGLYSSCHQIIKVLL